jgi:hypothetical protein
MIMENIFTKKCGLVTHDGLISMQSTQKLFLLIVISLMINLTVIYVFSTQCSAASASLLRAFIDNFGRVNTTSEVMSFVDGSTPATRLVGGS